MSLKQAFFAQKNFFPFRIVEHTTGNIGFMFYDKERRETATIQWRERASGYATKYKHISIAKRAAEKKQYMPQCSPDGFNRGPHVVCGEGIRFRAPQSISKGGKEELFRVPFRPLEVAGQSGDTPRCPD